MIAMPRLKYSQVDVLREVVLSGVFNAAEGLSEMVGRTIRIEAPEVKLVDICRVTALLTGPEDEVAGVYLAFRGDVNGHISLLLSPPEALELVDMLMGVPFGSTTVLGPMERSALGEVGNLTGSFFLNALAECTELTSQPSPPAVIVDMGAAVLDLPLVLLAQSSEEALIIDTTFVDDTRSISALFLVMPDMPSLKTILAAVERLWPSR